MPSAGTKDQTAKSAVCYPGSRNPCIGEIQWDGFNFTERQSSYSFNLRIHECIVVMP